MKITKVHFEFRYKFVYDFARIYQKILLPYFKLDDIQFGVNNEGKFRESGVINFLNPDYRIDFRMDRIILIYEGDLSVINKSNGPTKFFFDILKALSKYESYSHGVANILLMTAIIPSEDTQEVIVEKFKNRYLSNTDNLLENPSDIGIRLLRQDERHFSSIEFGPYEIRDIEHHKLSPINSQYNDDLLEAKGILVKVQLNEPAKNPSLTNFNKLYQNVIETFSKIEI